MARKTQQQRRIEALLATHTKAIQAAFIEAMSKASNAVDRTELLRLLALGDIERAAQLFRIERGLLYPIEKAIQDAMIGGGLAISADLPKGLSGQFGFNGGHPRAVALAQDQAARLVTNISDDAIIAARKVITDGIASNRSLDSVARDLVGPKVGQRRVGGIIGLTEPMTDQVINARALLGDPDRIGDYFKADGTPRYKLSDRRFDKIIKAAIKDGKAMAQTDIDRVVEAHKAKATGYRGKVVARNEAFVAQASGRNEGYQQLIESGKVESITVRWQHNLSINARPDHADMDGKTIQLGEYFEFGGGVRMKFPHDPAGGVEHSINCRCIAVHRVNLPRD